MRFAAKFGCPIPMIQDNIRLWYQYDELQVVLMSKWLGYVDKVQFG